MLRRLRDERGNITILMIAMTLGFLCLMAIFYDFLTLYVGKRVGQKAADAAALASAYEWIDQTESDGENRATADYKDFLAQMTAAIDDQVDDWERTRRAYLTGYLTLANPQLSPQEIAAMVSQTIAAEKPAVQDHYRSDYIEQHIRTAGLRATLVSHQTPSADELKLEFISPIEAGCIAYQAGFKAQAKMNTVAAYYVKENGSETPKTLPLVEYPVAHEGRTQIRLTAARRIELGVFDEALDDAHRYLQVRALATVRWLGPVAVQWSPGCGGS